MQGDDEWLVATGAADATYAFEVTVVAPSELTAGEAEVQPAGATEDWPTAKTPGLQ